MNFIQSLTGQTASPPPLNIGQTSGLSNFLSSMPNVEQFSNFGGNFMPYASSAFGNLFNNPFAGSAVGAAENAAGLGQDIGMRSIATGGGVTGAGGSLFDVAGGIPGIAYGTAGAGQSLYPQGENQFATAQGLAPYGFGALNTAQNLFPMGNAAFGAGASLFPAGANTMQTAQNLFPAGNAAIAGGAGMIPGAYSILNAGFDPQNALYNRTTQQVQDQTRAGLEARGVDTTPYGAGVEGKTMSDFNIDWQNNLLNRMATAGGAAGSLLGAGTGAMGTGAGIYGQGFGGIGTGANLFGTGFSGLNTGGGLYGQGFGGVGTGAGVLGTGSNIAGTGANIFGTGASMGGTGVGELGTLAQIFGQGGNLANLGTGMQMQAPQYMASLGALPYSTFQGISGDQMNAVMQMLGYGNAGQQLGQLPVQDFAQLYGLGNQQQNVANAIYGNQIKQQQNQFQDMMSLGKGLGSMFGAMPWGSVLSSLGGGNPLSQSVLS